MVNILVGHSSFYLRSGWLKKGIEYIENNRSENIFSKNNIEAIDNLGIGSVMVQSLKFWLFILDVIEKDGNGFKLKREIDIILKEDPYLQKNNTLWLLHVYIMERDNSEENVVLWNLFIKNKKNSIFSEEEAKKILIDFYASKKEKISERSVKDSINVFIKMYFKNTENKEDPEDNLFSPFIKLNYLLKNENGKYYFRNIDSTEIAEEIVYFLLKRKAKNKQISISDSYNYVNEIIKMRRIEYEKLITKLENKNFIFVDRAAGLQNINIIKNISEKDIIQLIMERE